MKYMIEYDPEDLDFDTVCSVISAIEHQIAEFEDIELDSYYFKHGNVHVELHKKRKSIIIKLGGDKHGNNYNKE